ncbi:unnamed protein product [Sphagnum jensenii]|uniref:Glutaredoxin domain-containing protein n=1 Tax=Sphagnum jensenii TaxID=128206 RepID=A0ABP1AUV5_9BRYO
MGCNTSKSSSFASLQVERERIPFRSLSMLNYRTAAPPKEAGLQYNTHTVALTSSTYGIMKLVESANEDRALASVIAGGAGGGRDAGAPGIKRHKKMMKMSSKDLEEEEEIEIIDVWELMKGLEEDRTPTTTADGFLEGSSSNDINLFDPKILADFADSFERNSEASDCCKKMSSSKVSPIDDKERKGSPLDHPHPLASYELKCPPGGEERVVLYSTSLRGIRQTFESCNNVRMILESFNVHVDERDVSMHAGFREELKALIGKPIVSVPRVFINGYYIGGAEEVIELHEDGLLLHLVETLPVQTSRQICDCCGGIRFVPCTECSGSCKILTHSTNKVTRCPYCNENGLIRCTLCF